MSNEEIAEKIVDEIDNEVRELLDDDWLEVLNEIISNLKMQVMAKEEERDD